MKKIFTLLVALTTIVCSLNAEVLLNESFNRNVGNLNVGDYQNMGTDQTNWWYTSSSTSTKVQVIDTTLTKAGYQANPSGKAIQFKGNAQKDVRAFSRFTPETGKSIYYSVLLNVKALKSKSTSKENLITLTDASTTAAYCYAELRFLNNYDDNTYQLGVTKANENGVRWSQPLPLDSTILAVIRYDFIEGDSNDVAFLWINPTKLDEGKPTTQCVQDTASGSGAKWGAKEKVDPSGLKWVYLKPTTNTVNILLDEIRVATKWADLFEGAPEEASLKVTPSSTSESYIFQGDSKEYTFEVSGKLLTSDVTISHTNTEVELSTTSLTKEDVMDTTSFKATLTANAAGAQVDTIVLTSGTLVKKIPMVWNTIEVTACANVAALKAAVESEEEYTKYVRLTGEAIVTRDVNSGTRELFIEDASGAAKLTDDYEILDAGSLVGAKIKNLLLLNGPAAWGVQPFMVQGKPTVVSTGNEVEPQEVTLATLQANATDYLYELVKIKDVTFTNAGETFAVGQYAISQSTETAKVKVENNNIVGNTIPANAHVIGFSFNTSGSVILPRTSDDIIASSPQPTGVEEAAAGSKTARKFIYNGSLYIERNGGIYTIAGQKL